MVVAEIDRDYLWQRSDADPSRVGRKFEMTVAASYQLTQTGYTKVRWRTKDDDGDICYGGWLLNDSEGEVQQEILRYCQADVGATIIEIKVINAERGTGIMEWVQEIG